MEEKNSMTAERSLEIITEQIERNRKIVAKNTGQSLYIIGLCITCTALLVGCSVALTGNAAFYFLFILLPFIIYGIKKYVNRNKPKTPESFIGNMVNKTWLTFAIFSILFYVFSILFNRLMLYDATVAGDMMVYLRNLIRPFRIILLIMGMAITINGYILKSRWLVWCGIIGGIIGFFWESFCGTETILSRLYKMEYLFHFLHVFIPCFIVALYAFVGLLLPGIQLKRQK